MKVRIIFLGLVILAGFYLRMFVSVRLYSGDVNNHIAWGKEIDISGPAGVYEKEFTTRYRVMAPTYPPVALWLFAGAYKIFGQAGRLVNVLGRIAPQTFTSWVIAFGHPNILPSFLKIPAMLADIGIAVLIYLIVIKVTKSQGRALVTMVVVLFNPAVWFNSAAWGQIESIPIFFAVLAALLLIEDHLYWAAVSLVVSVLVKQSAVILLPLFFVFLYKKQNLLFCIKVGVLQALVFIVAFLPFARALDFLWPLRIYLEKIVTGSGSDFVTDHAFNLWVLLSGLSQVPDAKGWLLGIPYGLYATVLLGLSALWILVWLFRNNTVENLWKSWILISMSVFFLATRMHERYLGPVFILWLLPWGKWSWLMVAAYAYLSVFHLANLYHNWWEPNIGWVVQWLDLVVNIKAMIVVALAIYIWLLLKWTRHEAKA